VRALGYFVARDTGRGAAGAAVLYVLHRQILHDP
jgi:hypothetical protein